MTKFLPPRERFELGIDWSGGFNKMPTPYTYLAPQRGLELLLCGDWTSFPTMTHDYFRQVRDLLPGEMVELKVYWADLCYIGVADYYGRDSDLKPEWMPVGTREYRHHLGFYWIGCRHEGMRPVWKSMHVRHDECPHCDYHAIFDTSG